MNYIETETVIQWAQMKRGRLTALASSLGFDRRVFHNRLNNFKTHSLDVDTVWLQQAIIEQKEIEAKNTLLNLKIWLGERNNRKKALAVSLSLSTSTITGWFKADSEDTCLIDWLDSLKEVLPKIEQDELNNFSENRIISNAYVREYNRNKAFSINELYELARKLIKFSNAENKTAIVVFSRGRIIATGWAINSLSKNFIYHGSLGKQGHDISCAEICSQNLKKQYKTLETVVCVGELDANDLFFIEKMNPNVFFHNLRNDEVLNVLKSKNTAVCKL